MAAITATYGLMDEFSAVIALWRLTEEKDTKTYLQECALLTGLHALAEHDLRKLSSISISSLVRNSQIGIA
jgi:hypothetical protein